MINSLITYNLKFSVKCHHQKLLVLADGDLKLCSVCVMLYYSLLVM